MSNQGVIKQIYNVLRDFKSVTALTYAGPLETNKYKGHYYGMPLDTNTRVMLYNKAVLAKAGVSQPPKTFADLAALGDKLDGTGDSAFADNGLSGWNVLPWIWSGGGDITNADYTKATGYLNSDKTMAALQTLLDLYKAKQIPPTLVGNKGGVPPGDGLAKAKYASILDGPWMYPIFKAQYPKFDVQAALVPSLDGHSVSVVGGEDVVMTKSSKNPALAAQFIRHLLSKPSQLAMAKVGQMPVLSSLGADLASVQPYYGAFVEQLATARPRPPVATWPKIDELLQTNLQKVFTGKAALKPTLDETAAQIDQLLAQG
jgi:multiple sugar transport system substrate-binding protein